MSVRTSLGFLERRNYKMAGVEATPNPLFMLFYNSFSSRGTLYQDDHGFWMLSIDDGVVKLPRPKEALRFTHIGASPRTRVYDKYTDSGDFTPEDGDVVIDVGSYLGEFSTIVADRHDCDVFAIEPDPRSIACLKYNSPDGVDVIGKAVGDRDTDVVFQAANDPSESGVLQPDNGKSERYTVDMARLDTLVDAVGYLKVEAEGYEPEVLEGMGALRPKRVVVDVSAERWGKSPAAECRELLRDMDYTTKKRGTVLRAWQPGVDV